MRILSAALLVVALSGLALAFQDSAAKPVSATATPSDAQVIAQQLPSYPLTTCPISHEALDSMGKPLDLVQDGRLVRLCCKSCVKQVKKDAAATAAVFKLIDESVVKAQKDSYPLKTCPISGEPLAGGAIDQVTGTRLVRLCCKDCVAGLQKDPAKALAKVDAALIAEQKKTYPLTTCVVSGEAIEGEGFDMLHGTRLVRLCCEKCSASITKEPAKYLAKLDQAAPKKN